MIFNAEFSNIIAASVFLNLRSLLEKIVTRSLEGGVGFNRIPPPRLLSIHPID